jgi:hypothetical protein
MKSPLAKTEYLQQFELIVKSVEVHLSFDNLILT